jgi:hypothetical protein
MAMLLGRNEATDDLVHVLVYEVEGYVTHSFACSRSVEYISKVQWIQDEKYKFFC